jgi:hypothetical protein
VHDPFLPPAHPPGNTGKHREQTSNSGYQGNLDDGLIRPEMLAFEAYKTINKDR